MSAVPVRASPEPCDPKGCRFAPDRPSSTPTAAPSPMRSRPSPATVAPDGPAPAPGSILPAAAPPERCDESGPNDACPPVQPIAIFAYFLPSSTKRGKSKVNRSVIFDMKGCKIRVGLDIGGDVRIQPCPDVRWERRCGLRRKRASKTRSASRGRPAGIGKRHQRQRHSREHSAATAKPLSR